MSTFKWQIQWRTVDNLDRIREAIQDGNDDFPGLTSAEQIISITWREDLHRFYVVWKEREWQGGMSE